VNDDDKYSSLLSYGTNNRHEKFHSTYRLSGGNSMKNFENFSSETLLQKS